MVEAPNSFDFGTIFGCGMTGRKAKNNVSSIPWHKETASNAATLALAAQEAADAGDSTKAIALYARANELSPTVSFLLAAGNLHLQRGEMLSAIELHERCVLLRQSTQESSELDMQLAMSQTLAATAVAKAAAAMKAAAEMAVSATEAEAAAKAASKQARGSPQGVMELSLRMPSGVDYNVMTYEDKVDALRMVVPTCSSQELRKILDEEGGDVHLALRAATLRK